MTQEESKQLAPQRWERLLRLVRDEQVVRVDELSETLGVSAATVRRDLAALEEQGEIRRVHGGAVSLPNRLDEPLFDDKTSIAAREKHAIAQAALQYIEPGDTIYLDGGSTVLELARLLRDRTDITVLTHSLRAAHELAAHGPKVILVGGELRRRSQTFVGPLTRLMLTGLHVDKAFMGTIGLTLDEGLTTTDTNEAYTKELVMQCAEEVICLVDSSKAGKVAFARAGRLEDVDRLISDAKLDGRFAQGLRKFGIDVVRV